MRRQRPILLRNPNLRQRPLSPSRNVRLPIPSHVHTSIYPPQHITLTAPSIPSTPSTPSLTAGFTPAIPIGASATPLSASTATATSSKRHTLAVRQQAPVQWCALGTPIYILLALQRFPILRRYQNPPYRRCGKLRRPHQRRRQLRRVRVRFLAGLRLGGVRVGHRS